MYTTQMRIEQVKRRSEHQKKRARNHWIFRFSILCCILTIQGISFVSSLQGTQGYYSQRQEGWMYGSTFLFSDIGGYVLVAILSFVFAVILTMVCVHYREKSKETNNANYKEGDV